MFFARKLFPQKDSLELDIEKVRFIDSETQRQYIEEQVKLFNQHRDELLKIDKTLGLGVGAETLVWMVGLPTWAVVVLSGAIGYWAFFHAMRQQHAEQFQTQLTKLMQIYHWCEKEYGARITHHPSFIKVLEAIAPFVKKRDIILWDLRNTHPSDISAEFAEIVAKSPHRIEIVKTKDNETSAFGLSTLFASSKSENPVPTNPENNDVYSTFEQFIAAGKRALYGPKTESVRRGLHNRV